LAYTPSNWQDRVSANPGQFSATGAVTGTITLTLNDNPSQAGTPITAARMTNIENELVYLDGLNYKGYALDTGTTNAFVVTLDPPITSYTPGLCLSFKAANTNFGASTLNVNGLGAITITKFTTTNNLTTADILSGSIATVMYDGTYFQLISGKPTWMYKQVFTSSGSFTAPYYGTYKVTVTGGGGSGGNNNANTSGNGGASGGGGAGTAIKWLTLSANQVVTVTVGSGGAACSNVYNSNSSGNTGGSSSFGSYCSATGGHGGVYSGSAGGGSGSNGDINLSGETTQLPAENIYSDGPVSTNGGSSYWGGGSSYGAGSSGVATGTSQAGMPGLVLIEWVG
jgi:hypothetical protein